MHYKTYLQYLLPHHLLSRLVGSIANCRWPWLKNMMINWFCQRYKIDLTEAIESDPKKYDNFNAFFTRALKPDARPMPEDSNAIISPIDGYISQFGQLNKQQLIQAKGKTFNLASLLSDKLADYYDIFTNGNFATLYLSPADYHRVHMPFNGKLIKTVHIPGKLFSVNQLTTNEIDNLYGKNERVIALFTTDIGPMAVIFVGAMLVASIKTSRQGIVTPPTSKKVRSWDEQNESHSFNIGDEIGQFQFGSTVILLLPPNSISWNETLSPTDQIRFGDILGQRN